MDLIGFLKRTCVTTGQQKGGRLAKGQEGGRKRQPARCLRKTQDNFAIASMAGKLLQRCKGAHALVVEIYLYMCAYAYIYTYMYLYIYMRMYIYIYIHAYTYVYVNVCMYMSMYACIHIYIYVYAYIYILCL